MTKVKQYKAPTHELMATLNLIKLSLNHRNEKTEEVDSMVDTRD